MVDVPVLWIIIPCYNEEEVLPVTAPRFLEKLKELIRSGRVSSRSRILFVNDGSSDNTWGKITALAAKNPRIVGVNFSRNFGKESAIMAGLAQAKGDCVAVMDCDLQHPPETLVEMLHRWQEGYEVVEGVKRSRGKESALHRFAAGTFYRLMSSATKVDMSRASDFKLMDRKAVNAILSLPEKNAFFRALSSWVGFRTTSVEFDVQDREAGSSKWSSRSLAGSAPLQLITVCGIVVLVMALILGVQTLVRYFSGTAVAGFTTVILLILLIGSVLMLSLGLIGYYLAQIYNELKGRPRYLISEILRGSAEAPAERKDRDQNV